MILYLGGREWPTPFSDYSNLLNCMMMIHMCCSVVPLSQKWPIHRGIQRGILSVVVGSKSTQVGAKNMPLVLLLLLLPLILWLTLSPLPRHHAIMRTLRRTSIQTGIRVQCLIKDYILSLRVSTQTPSPCYDLVESLPDIITSCCAFPLRAWFSLQLR